MQATDSASLGERIDLRRAASYKRPNSRTTHHIAGQARERVVVAAARAWPPATDRYRNGVLA